MRFVIYLDDHAPVHVHVYGDGEARIDLLNLRVLSARGMTKRDVARALVAVTQNCEYMLGRWAEIHG